MTACTSGFRVVGAFSAFIAVGVLTGCAGGIAPATTSDVTSSPSETIDWETDTNGTGVLPTVPGPGDCAAAAHIAIYANDGDSEWRVGLSGELVDMGASESASGAPVLEPDGSIRGYIVETDDTYEGIGERFCVDYSDVEIYNAAINGSNGSGGWPLKPGDELLLLPDPDRPVTGMAKPSN